MSKQIDNALRNKYVDLLTQLLAAQDEDVLRVGTGEIALPVVDDAGEDNYIVITVKVPTGTRDGDAYDAYAEAEAYVMKQEEKKEKEAKAAQAKAEKIARDAKMRAAKKAAKENHSK